MRNLINCIVIIFLSLTSCDTQSDFESENIGITDFGENETWFEKIEIRDSTLFIDNLIKDSSVVYFEYHSNGLSSFDSSLNNLKIYAIHDIYYRTTQLENNVSYFLKNGQLFFDYNGDEYQYFYNQITMVNQSNITIENVTLEFRTEVLWSEDFLRFAEISKITDSLQFFKNTYVELEEEFIHKISNKGNLQYQIGDPYGHFKFIEN